jgi:hypothetical protein
MLKKKLFGYIVALAIIVSAYSIWHQQKAKKPLPLGAVGKCT